MSSIERALHRQLLDAKNADRGWGYEPGRMSRLEPTCWALLALKTAGIADDRILSGWPSAEGALIEQAGGVTNWSFHSLALLTRVALGDAAATELRSMGETLSLARGIKVPPSDTQRQDNALQGWSWIDGTFSWVEPTAWALLALKTCRARGIPVANAEKRIRCGEAILRDRVCSAGGWNYGNSNVFGKSLPAYIPTTAIAMLALQDRGHEGFVRQSLDYLETQAVNHSSARALALSTLALRRHGRSSSLVEGALRTWLTNHSSPDVASAAMALCALEKTDGDEFAY